MNTYVILLRGINVGGKNKVSMTELKRHLEELSFSDVTPYIASGNIIVRSSRSADKIKSQIEETLPKTFKLDSKLIKVLVLTRNQFRDVITGKPVGFGEEPEKYHSDVIFLMEIAVTDALPLFKPREGVDTVWPGHGVIYSQRLSAERTKSRLGAIMMSPLYKSMTIRSWNTVKKLVEISEEVEARKDT